MKNVQYMITSTNLVNVLYKILHGTNLERLTYITYVSSYEGLLLPLCN